MSALNTCKRDDQNYMTWA